MEIFNKKILLNSHSPRRKQILEQSGFHVTVVNSNCEETFDRNLSPEDAAVFLARKKADAYQGKIDSDEILISADTIVVNGNDILGKPKDAKDAFNMLKNLSDRTHYVITGCCLKTQTKVECFYEKTEVKFAPLSDEEIEYYVREKKPMDKAGAYGIQEWIGMTGIKGIKGDFYNVMGLPSCKLWQKIKELA